jgi:hypothetical protein
MRVESELQVHRRWDHLDLSAVIPKAGGRLKITACLLLVVLLAGCVPIGIRAQNLPYAAIVVSQ